MKHRVLMVILVSILAICLTACGCEHEWEDATCVVPKTCKLCGETEGEVLTSHQWQPATCLAPKTCKICGTTEGELGDHVWEEATCTSAKTCTTCKKTEGEALGHQWVEATCAEPKTCTVCSEKEGEALGHEVSYWKNEKRATCTEFGSEFGTCKVCNEKVSRHIPMLDHKPGKWEVWIHATMLEDGMEAQYCTVCKNRVEERSYELPSFDNNVLKHKAGYEYDEFANTWKYYKIYTKRWSNADENIIIILFSEKATNLVNSIELRAYLNWKDSDDVWQVKTVEFMVGDRIYSCEMTSEEGEKLAYANLTSDVSYQMIQNIATCNNVKAKITYTNGSTQELNVGTQLRGICKDIVDLDLWYYYPNRYVYNTDCTKVR